MRVCSWFILAAALVASPKVIAHDSPEHVIEDLTAIIAKRGATPELLRQRANEHRIMRQFDHAAADLEKALKLRANYVPALVELARVRVAQQNSSAAVPLLNAAIKASRQDAALHFERATVYAGMGENRKALADCEKACKLSPAELDWYLLRSELLTRLGKPREKLRVLKDAYAATGSVAMHIEWIESLIDAGEHESALKEIETELGNDPRWRSSWLLRRARARLGLRQIAAAHTDVREALNELAPRLDQTKPDITLVIDRGMGFALLGEKAKAREALERAVALQAEPSMVRRLEAAIAALP